QLKAFAPKMVSFSGGVRFTETVKAGLHIQMSERQAAVDLRQTLELSKLLVAVVIANDKALKDYAPLLTDILNAFQFKQDNDIVGVDVTIPEEMLEKVLPTKPQP